MTIDEKLEIIRKAIELGAKVEFSFYNTNKKRDERAAKELSKQLEGFTCKDYKTNKAQFIHLKKPFGDKLEGIIHYD